MTLGEQDFKAPSRPTPRVQPRLRPIAYVAHPIAGDVAANVASAHAWLRWLMESEIEVSFVAPYLTTIAAGAKDEDPVQRQRGMADNFAVIERCEGIVLCGGRVSRGMGLELEHARKHGRRAVDLTRLGASPPASLLAGLRDELVGAVR